MAYVVHEQSLVNARLQLGSMGAVVAILLATTTYGCTSGADDPAPQGDSLTADPTRSPANKTTTKAVVDAGAGEGGDPATDPESGDQPGTLSNAYTHFDVNHIIVTGQSNSVANGGTPYLTKVQPASNLMFDTGVMPVDNCNGDGCYAYQTPKSFVPLVEGDHFFDFQVETPSSGLGNGVSNLAKVRYGFGGAGAPASEDVLVSVNGRSGNTLWCIGKGSCPYHDAAMLAPWDQAMRDVQNAKSIALASNLTYVVRGVALIHGESDHYGYAYGTPEFPRDGSDGTPGKLKDYGDGIIELQQDYDTNVKVITGQTQPVPLFISQISGWTDETSSKIAIMQYNAHLRAPGKVVLVAPGYPLSVQTDCLHYNADGYRRLGEYFAKAYARTVFENKPWEPLRPKLISHAGNVITVKYYVPKMPLAIDTTRVSDPGNYGFGFADDGGAQITLVELAGPDTVKITLSKAVSSNAHLTYALNQPAGSCIGPGTTFGGGARGNLRDSDDAPSQYGYDLQNWGVQFDLPVP